MDEPLISSGRRSSMRTLIAGVGVFLFLGTIVGLLAYDVYLTKKIHSNTANPNTGGNGNNFEYAEQITSWMDFSADPCVDFYQYSCGGYVANTNLPPGVNMLIPVFSEVQYDNYVVLNDIVNDQWPLINDLYASCMLPSAAVDSDTTSTFNSLLATVQTLNSTSPSDLFPLLASLHRMGVQAFFVPTQQQNIFQANPLIDLLMYDASLPLDLTTTPIQAALAEEIYADVSPYMDFSLARATNVVTLEASLNSIYYEPDNYSALFVNMTWQDFLTLTGVNYSIYTDALGLDMNSTSTVIAATPQFFSGLSQFYSTNLQTVADYLSWRVVYSYVYNYPITGDSLVSSGIRASLKEGLKNNLKSFFDFEVLRPRLADDTGFTAQQITCIDTVDTLLGDFLGLIFTMKTLDDDVVNDIRTVTGGIQSSFKNNLAGLSWIDDSSRAQANYKLSNIIQVIGHPNKLDRYRGLLLDPAHFLSNIISINQRVFDYNMEAVGTLYDRSQNEFPATIVNAFYNPMANTINFPAGILESPMFSADFPKLMQYARMGYVIGHETTHGFDNNGRLWNAQGVYSPIMDDASSIEFNTRAQCIVNQYNQFQPVPGHYVNGQQTLGENIADLGGVKNAFYAYQAWVQANGTADLELSAQSPIKQLTNEQLFFVVMGQTWCTKANDQGILSQLKNDVHSPSQYRVNGPLSNLDAFGQAFSCKAGTPMNPTNKCVLW